MTSAPSALWRHRMISHQAGVRWLKELLTWCNSTGVTNTASITCTQTVGRIFRELTWLLWMEMAQASLRGSCWRLRWTPPPDLNTQRSGFSTSVVPHRKCTRGSPGVEVGSREWVSVQITNIVHPHGRRICPIDKKCVVPHKNPDSEIETYTSFTLNL